MDIVEGDAVTVTIPAPSTSGDWDIAAIRRYREAETFNGGTKPGVDVATRYLFVAELPPAAQTYVDTLATDALGEALVCEQYTPPPVGLEGITQLPNGVLAGFVGQQLWFCESYEPQAWPIDYLLARDDTVRALRWQDDVLYAMTDGNPYAVSEECAEGTCCRKAYRLPRAAPIVSRKSAVVTPNCVVYASDSGLIQLAGKRMATLTGPWFARDDWQAIRPHTMTAAIVDGQFIGATCCMAFLFDMRDGTENDVMGENDYMPLFAHRSAVR
ncbi:hypothetical protein CBA19CS22_39650 [Caballeronia novacaledonica]|uniref:Uncharacterized protein n=1 Tax=Caballeronia novacaledonica TaxID=1544861 RepID=A0ACB5R5W2_9BURK|nr:hypothetical protein CBA19CS22_39650 [Caballeronia novacaledonica]